MKWPRDVWPLLLQCVFTGKAQDAYAALSPEVSLDYDKVKVAVVRTYELVPEAYRFVGFERQIILITHQKIN